MKFESNYQLTEKVSQGIWRTLPSGLKVKVASIRSPNYKTSLMRLQKQFAAELRANDDEVINLITSKAMAESILLDWQGAEDNEGNPIEYTKELAEQMLLQYELFREEVSLVATSDSNYTVGEIAGK